MFSGIIEEAAQVVSIVKGGQSHKLSVKSSLNLSDVQVGDSIAIEGVCLTVVEKRGPQISFDLADETLRRSTLNELHVGSAVNFERSLKMGERIHGHLVFGHVDATVEIIDCYNEGVSTKLVLSFPEELRPFLAEKGSVALAGTSLTIGEVEQHFFSVYLVPHTKEKTTLMKRKRGDKVNVEVDMLARYVVNALVVGQASQTLSVDFLKSHGFLPEE